MWNSLCEIFHSEEKQNLCLLSYAQIIIIIFSHFLSLKQIYVFFGRFVCELYLWWTFEMHAAMANLILVGKKPRCWL